MSLRLITSPTLVRASRITSNITVNVGFTEIVFNSAPIDTSGGLYSTATGRFTSDINEYWRVSYNGLLTTGTGTTSLETYIFVNGSSSNYYGYWTANDLVNAKSYSCVGSDIVYLAAGQYLSLFAYSYAVASTFSFSAQNSFKLTIERAR